VGGQQPPQALEGGLHLGAVRFHFSIELDGRRLLLGQHWGVVRAAQVSESFSRFPRFIFRPTPPRWDDRDCILLALV
jgi:hypothetical protein